MPVLPFAADVTTETLDDLRRRLTNTRWPDALPDAKWDYGTDVTYLRSLTDYWRKEFNWHKQAKAFHRFPHFRAQAGDFGLHFLHQRGRGRSPMPLLLLHGYPDSFLRFIKLIPLLTDPMAHGGAASDAFDVVVPSLPGYGFSDRPTERGFNTARMAAIVTELMTDVLGYEKFGAHGGDWGSVVTEQIARRAPDSLSGIHLTNVPWAHAMQKPENLTPAEATFLVESEKWLQAEGAYALIQGTKPQSLAYGLNDSPVGLAAWIVEKFRAWSDCGGDIEKRFTKDELLTNITLYWVTQTIGSATRLYYEDLHSPPTENAEGRVATPTGFAIFPGDINPPPQDWGERFFNVTRWTRMPQGGHFAAMEEPQRLAEEIRAFFRPLRT